MGGEKKKVIKRVSESRAGNLEGILKLKADFKWFTPGVSVHAEAR